MTPCQKPIDYEKLTAWWLNELQDESIDEHLLACAHCSERAEKLAAYAQGIKALVQDGRLSIALTPKFLDHLKHEGLRIREYPAKPGETINCTIGAEDDAVVSRLKATLAGASRVDALHSIEVGCRIERLKAEDIPFDAQAGEVLLMPSPTQLRNMPAHTWRVQLVAVEEGRERVLGDYTFQHAPA
jgi:hypothetical protein